MVTFICRKPFLSFVAVSYLFSWGFWVASFVAPEGAISLALFHLAGFGPLVATLVVLSAQGRSLPAWVKNRFKWRLHPGWYLFALGFPMLLVAIVSGIYLLQGQALDVASLPQRLAAYPSALLPLFLIGGGNEEPGWRGFGLPTLQQRHSPITATFILGIIWAFWHLPLLKTNPDVASGAIGTGQILLITVVTLISITTHAFWYTWLFNKTGSVLLCMLLHASYNAANSLLLLVPAEALRGQSYQSILALMTLVLVLSVVGLLAATRGRLGARYRLA